MKKFPHLVILKDMSVLNLGAASLFNQRLTFKFTLVFSFSICVF